MKHKSYLILILVCVFFAIFSLTFQIGVQKSNSKITEDCVGNGSDYRGIIDFTESGKVCKYWTNFWYITRPLADLTGNNYCRNPDSDPNGPWCFTRDNETGKESCGITCDDGYSVLKIDTSCKFVQTEPIQNSGNLGNCQKKCLETSECDLLQYRSSDFQCFACKNSDDIGVFNPGWNIYQKFNFPKKCYFKSINYPDIDSTKCNTSKGPLNDFDCNIFCSKNYIGTAFVVCNTENDDFELYNNCEKGCYLSDQTAAANFIDNSNCNSYPSKLSSSCEINCNSQSYGDVKANCLHEGNEFSINGSCVEYLCKINYKTFDNNKLNISGCKMAEYLPSSQCDIQCGPNYAGEVNVFCYGKGKDFVIKENCVSNKCYFNENDQGASTVDSSGCPKNVLLYAEECVVKCDSSLGVGGNVLLYCNEPEGYFDIENRCEGNKCNLSDDAAEALNIDNSKCKGEISVNDCILSCKEDFIGGPAAVSCNAGGGDFTISGECKAKS